MAVSGPRAKQVLDQLELGVSLDDAGFAHMSVQHGSFRQRPARIARVSFTGERSYEISVPAGLAHTLWQAARAAGAAALGVEALGVLRAEKGFLFIGQDTDSETMPQDLGMDGPRQNRRDSYVGDRSLLLPVAKRAGRRQLVGIAASADTMIPPGAHAVCAAQGRPRSIGFITSSYHSYALDRPIALALIEDGLSRQGEVLAFEHLGTRHAGTVVGSCFLDPTGGRLHV
jgi:sarcosine oxidase subunit alpha